MAGRFLGIDYGRTRIGVAVSDALGISIRAIGHIRRESDAQAAGLVARMARQERVVGIVLGWPLHAHGATGENTAWVESFAAVLAACCDLPQYRVDERHSSQEAEDTLRALGRWPAPAGQSDAQAAAIILRRFLDGEDRPSTDTEMVALG